MSTRGVEFGRLVGGLDRPTSFASPAPAERQSVGYPDGLRTSIGRTVVWDRITDGDLISLVDQ